MFYEYATDGVPMIKPLVYFDQEDAQTHYRTDEFIFGRQIMVCPILEPNAKGRRMYIARGKWYNHWDHSVIEGGKEMWVDADIDQIPIYIKEGAIIPRYPVQQYVGEKEIDELTLEVFYKNGTEKSKVYEDATDGYDYKKGRYSLRDFKLTGKDNELILQQHKSGTFQTSYENIKIKFIGLPFKVTAIEIDNVLFTLKELEYDTKANVLTVSKDFTEIHILS